MTTINFQRPSEQFAPVETQALVPNVVTPHEPPYVALLQQSLINQREILTWQQRTAVELRELKERKRIDIKIQDANIPFWNLVGLMLKVAFAAIPAFIIFAICGVIMNVTILGGLLRGLR